MSHALTDSATPTRQTSLRLSARTFGQFRQLLRSRGLKMNSVMEALVQAYVDAEGGALQLGSRKDDLPNPFVGEPLSWDPLDLLKAFVGWIPAAVVVKEQHGRLLCANDGFCQLFGRRNLIGLAVDEYAEAATAKIVAEHDRLVLDNGQPLLCAEHLPIGGMLRRRVTLRFPIVFNKVPQLIGALGFDVDDMLIKVRTLPRSGVGLTRACKVSGEVAPSIEASRGFNSDSLLRAFIDSLPAIATVKDMQGRLLCVNPAYTAVTGKEKAAVKGQLPKDNWPPELARWIMVHDQFVRDTQCPYLSVDTIVRPGVGASDRLNIRFPIFSGVGSDLVLTGSFGFDYAELMRVLDAFDDLPAPSGSAFELDSVETVRA